VKWHNWARCWDASLPYDMISALAGIEEEMLQSGLGQLVVDELLYQRGRPPRSRYLFKHALIQDAAYQSLLKRTRQQYHQQVEKLLEDRFPELASTQTGIGRPPLHRSELSDAGDRVLAQSRRGRGEAVGEPRSDRPVSPRPRTGRGAAGHARAGRARAGFGKWRSVLPCTRLGATATLTSVEPMRGRGSSISSSMIIPASSRRFAACSSTI
jgi:hypothetical protein